jgi:hypothetical protein
MTTIQKGWDIDLKFGQEGERWLTLLASERKVEVKRERDKWATTGNILFEVRYKGCPSGITATESDFWAHLLSLNGTIVGGFIFDSKALLRNLRRLVAENKVRTIFCGDGDHSEGVLVPLSLAHELLKPE